jgi:hypothetical protein
MWISVEENFHHQLDYLSFWVLFCYYFQYIKDIIFIFYYIRIYIKLLLFLFKIQLVNEFESDKLLQSDNCPPDRNPASAPVYKAAYITSELGNLKFYLCVYNYDKKDFYECNAGIEWIYRYRKIPLTCL